LKENSYNKTMKKFTQITFNPKGDSYDLFFLDGKLLLQGDYYHDKVDHLFEGVTIYLSFMKEEYSHERWNAEIKHEGAEYWQYDFEPDRNENIENLLKRLEKNFTLTKL